MAETGNAGDVDTFFQLLGHPSGYIRAEAAQAIAHLGGEEAAAKTVRLLDDPSGRARRAVATVLAAIPSHLWVTLAREILASGTPKGRIAALKTLGRRGGWDPLPDFLAAISSDEAGVRALGWNLLAAWQKHFGVRGWIRPTPECRAAFTPLWKTVRNQEKPPAWWEDFRILVEGSWE